ncbi:DMT family transporter [Altericroceibacterium endophyticum]|uniref:EamA family transporter n=1 Tax=Altericroceibacterium endophyticum TaxID=1808508 RepID=A0A6I4T2B9_9SPHN|nr:DMT family transporter [Altericroceibacterium endophyticum]MXO65354.1 EamA family transporter [Altericroceibacterium endophyticum]
MSVAVFITVVLAAGLHAVWNAMVKGGKDKYLSTASVVVGQAIFAIPTLFLVPAPDPSSYALLLAGIVLHLGYQFFLMASYRAGDLTQVYPLARGSAPLIVALISVIFLGLTLQPIELGAIAMIGLGIMSIAMAGKSDGLHNRKAAVLALVTGGFIASYSLVDGLGARQAGTALGYYGWLTIGNALAFCAITAVARPSSLKRLPVEGLRLMILGGGASYAAYALVIWSFTQAPIALVTALRETSIVFALLIGVFVLREKLSLGKVVSSMMVLAGMLMTRLGRSS